MRMWCMTLLEYDEFGKAKIISSFMKPAKDSAITKEERKKANKPTTKVNKEVSAW